MRENLLLTNNNHPQFNQDAKIYENMYTLLEQQLQTWELFKSNYSALDNVKIKKFVFENGITINVQFNPARVISSTAKVDPKSIKERKCFLCVNNLPEQQKGIIYKEKYLILVNPYPIFNQHFTIPDLQHTPQEILSRFSDMLDFSKDLNKKFVVFYNGPKCGASAPDHFHFQAGQRNFMSIDNEYEIIINNCVIANKITNNVSSYLVGENYLRSHFIFISNKKDLLIDEFNKLYKSMANGDEEPLMNIIVYWDNILDLEGWRIHIFPRKKHRPDCYFKEGDENITISPASVDIGGVMITPFEKDFEKITKNDLINIFREVTLSNGEILSIYENYLSL